MRIGKDELCKLIPHSGSMCLLDSVEYWDKTRIVCYTQSHLLPDNPLRCDGQLSLVSAIEYGAQGMAVHGGLLAQSDNGLSGPAYLASLKDITLESSGSLDRYPGKLVIEAEKIFADRDALVYDFSVSTHRARLMSGQAMVVQVGTY